MKLTHRSNCIVRAAFEDQPEITCLAASYELKAFRYWVDMAYISRALVVESLASESRLELKLEHYGKTLLGLGSTSIARRDIEDVGAASSKLSIKKLCTQSTLR